MDSLACNYSVSQDSFVAKPVLLPEKCWDVYCDILRSKNVFEKLDPGDSVMADKGFDVFLLSAYRWLAPVSIRNKVNETPWSNTNKYFCRVVIFI